MRSALAPLRLGPRLGRRNWAWLQQRHRSGLPSCGLALSFPTGPKIRNTLVTPAPHIQVKNMNKRLDNIWPQMLQNKANSAVLEPYFCSYFCLVCGGWGRKKNPQKIEKIQDRPPGLKFSMEIEIFKRATHQTPIFVGNSEGPGLKFPSEIQIFNRDWKFQSRLIFSIFGPLGFLSLAHRNRSDFCYFRLHAKGVAPCERTCFCLLSTF